MLLKRFSGTQSHPLRTLAAPSSGVTELDDTQVLSEALSYSILKDCKRVTAEPQSTQGSRAAAQTSRLRWSLPASGTWKDLETQ